MGNATDPNQWKARQRLEFIELAAYWRGWVRRNDVLDFFGISLPQASADFQAYFGINPASLNYNPRSKRYETAKNFTPRLTKPDLRAAMEMFLSPEQKAKSGASDKVATIDLPQRRIDTNVARDIFRAVFGVYRVRICYRSINSSRESLRWIVPHAFGYDGFRWHVRAFCEEEHRYKDFVLGRILQADAIEPPTQVIPKDDDWDQWVDLTIRPYAKMDRIQRSAVEHDFGMAKGAARFKVRKAMLEYTLAYLGIGHKEHLPRLQVDRIEPDQKPE